MSYSTGEAAVLVLVRALSAYDTNNSSRQDWKILGTGQAAVYAVLRPGAWSNQQNTMASNVRNWRTVIEVWRRYKNDTVPQTIQDDVETIVAQFEKYPTFNSTSGVIDSFVTGGGDLEEVTAHNAQWLRWEVYIDWQEEASVSYAE